MRRAVARFSDTYWQSVTLLAWGAGPYAAGGEMDTPEANVW